MFNLKFKCMRINDSCRGSKIFRALLILMLFALPAQSAIAQLTIRISNSSLGTVIKQIQSQSKYQFYKRHFSLSKPYPVLLPKKHL